MGDRAPGPRDAAPANPRAQRSLADKLFGDGRITKEQYDNAMSHQRRTSCRIEDALVDTDALTEQELLKLLAATYQVRFVSTEKLAKADIDRATLDKVPRKLVERLNIVPVLYDSANNLLSVITADPHNVDALEQVQKGAGAREVRPLIARPAAIQAAIAKFYKGDPFSFTGLDARNLGGNNIGGGLGSPGFAPSIGGMETSSPYSMGGMAAANPYSVGGMPAAAPAASPGPTFSLGGPPPPRQVEDKSGLSLPPMALPEDLWSTSQAFVETLNVLVTLLENSREGLRGHSAQVARLMRKMAERIGIAPAELNALIVAGYLHDLGKMGNFHLTALNVAQFEVPRAAAEKAYATPGRLMSSAKLVSATIQAIEQMYERYDGSGFPRQARAKEISLGARLLAITDSYSDLTENPGNSFGKKLSPVKACEALAKYKGTIFDPHLVDLFSAAMAGDDIRARILANRHVALLVDPDPEETTVLELRMIEEGFEVRIARTLAQAHAILQKGGVELVVSELDLAAEGSTPGEMAPGDGLSLLVEARRASWGVDLPWLILTRRQARDDARQAFELGAIDFVIKPAATEVLVAKLKKALEKRSSTTGGAPAVGVSGSLAEMSLPDLVQILWHGRKSGALRLRRGPESGEVHFAEGMVVNAMWGKLRAEDAFYAMLRISDGEFAFDPNYKAEEVVIKDSPEGLLLEGMRRLDEG
jgi:response regulator RpfG family c-di-GMP phosphodiesterase